MGKRKLRYCKNCNNYGWKKTYLRSDVIHNICWKDKTLDSFGNKISENICEFLNKNNNCDWYKRKWWKIWVR